MKKTLDESIESLNKKRKIFIILTIILCVCIVGVFSFVVYSYFFRFAGKEMHILTKDTRVAASKNSKTLAVTLYGCPNKYVLSSDNTKCVKDISLTYIIGDIKKYSQKKAYKLCDKKGYDSVTIEIFKNDRKVVSMWKCYNPKSVKSSKIVIPYYSQNNYTATAACSGGTFPNKGCLPTTSAMILSALLNTTITPLTLNDYAKDITKNKRGNVSADFPIYNSETKKIENKNYKVCVRDSSSGNISYYYEFLVGYATMKKLTVTPFERVAKDSSRITKIDSLLKSGKCMGFVALKARCGGRYCYNVPHFIAIYGNPKDKMIYVNDPTNSSSDKSGSVMIEDSLNNIVTYAQNSNVRVVCKK